ncbi:MAG: excinuclease ABC subunit UvrB [Mycoplasmataceae bacterium]|nr:excinuclease ABC subunit UvrB [Mycoplasmataceae bacterium]
MKFELKSKYNPSGDQPKAIKELIASIKINQHTVLLGATGTGKTFTMANIIEKYGKNTLVLAPNKTLANQLFIELKEMFPNNKVEYYISNFDFYQPEAYKPSTDTYIEKSSQQNWQLEMMRTSATTSLITNDDVIVVASVAAIFGHRNPIEYGDSFTKIKIGQKIKRKIFLYELVQMAYERKDDLFPGSFTTKGDVIEISPSWTDQFHLRIEMFGDEIEQIVEINNVTKNIIKRYDNFVIFPANFHTVKQNEIKGVVNQIEEDLHIRLTEFKKRGKLLEAQRLEQRVRFDIEQLEEFGMTSGIENYSIYFDKHRSKGETPDTLLSYFPKDYLLIIDESHLSIPQIKGMYKGDKSRKENLVEYGFRLPSALDNRPLMIEEFEKKIGKTVYVSATPSEYELEKSGNKFVEQIIRPTGLLDPIIELRPEKNQLDDLMAEIYNRKKLDQRVFINTTTKKLSEDIATYMKDNGISVAYLHYDLKTLEREDVLRKLRMGIYDCVVGINLLREGLDIPEVSLVAILDANKNGFMRNTRSLIQLIGRASRNSDGKVIMYADHNSKSMTEAIKETDRRREIQIAYNDENGIVPKTIIKDIPKPALEEFENRHKVKFSAMKIKEKLSVLEKEMMEASSKYDFERAIKLRDLITEIKGGLK